MNALIDISTVILKTDRLILRSWKETDLDDFFEYASVEGVGEKAGWHHHKDISETKKILDSFIKQKKCFAVEYNSKVIGSLGIEEYDEEVLPELKNLRGRELGYVLSKEYWEKGLMTEAVKGVIKYLFEEEHLDFILCSHFTHNIESKRVMEKCSFEYLKTYRDRTAMGIVENNNVNILFYDNYFEQTQYFI